MAAIKLALNQKGKNKMNDEPSFNQQQGAEDPVTTKGIAPSLYQCAKCPKSFQTKSGLRMHTGRAHTKTITNRIHRTPAARHERKKLYQTELRARYRAQGLNSRGEPLKDPNHYMRQSPHPWLRWRQGRSQTQGILARVHKTSSTVNFP